MKVQYSHSNESYWAVILSCGTGYHEKVALTTESDLWIKSWEKWEFIVVYNAYLQYFQ